MRFAVRYEFHVVLVRYICDKYGIACYAVFANIDRNAVYFPAVKHFIRRACCRRSGCIVAAFYGFVFQRGVLVLEYDGILLCEFRSKRYVLRYGVSVKIYNRIAVYRPALENIAVFRRRGGRRYFCVFQYDFVVVVFAVYHKIDLVFMRYVGNYFCVRRYAVSGKVDRLAVNRPAVEYNVSRRGRRCNRQKTVLVYYLYVVNAPVKLERGNDLLAAFQCRQILFVITHGLLQFRNFSVQSIDHRRIVLRLQCQIGNLIVQTCNLRVQPVYGARVQRVVFL